MRNLLLVLLFSTLSFGLRAQSFTNVDELLQASDMDPLEFEKTITDKGFTFKSTDGLKSVYNGFRESITYTITPRRVNYQTLSRSFFLEVNSRLIKQGFVLVSSEGVLEEDNKTIKAQQYQKGKFTVWIWASQDEDDDTVYHIQVDNSDPSSVKKSGNTSSRKEFKYKGEKEMIDFAYFYAGLMLPQGIIAQEPMLNSSYEEDYTGESGIGAKAGYETGVGGFIGFDALNQQLPRPLYLGILLSADFGMMSFSYESLGSPYDDYTFNDFIKLSGGLGPALALRPSEELDFKLVTYYRLGVAANFGGAFEYNGSELFYETMTRESATAALVNSFGLNLKAGTILGGIELSSYTDKGTFTLDRTVYDVNSGQYVGTPVEINAELPMRQLTLKFGLAF